MNPFELEAAIFKAWRKALFRGRPSAYEKKSDQGWGQVKTFHDVAQRDLERRVKSAAIVVFGDDRLVPLDQAKIIRWIRKDRRTAVFLTDRRGNLPLFRHLKDLKIPVHITNVSATLVTRDRALSRRAITEAKRGRKVWVWTGALRVSPSHLPARFRNAGTDIVFVNLQGKEARWRSQSAIGFGAATGNVLCDRRMSPLLCLDLLAAADEGTARSLDPEKLVVFFHHAVRRIASKMAQRIPPPPREILTPFQITSLKRFLALRLPAAERRFIRDRSERGESAVLPQRKIVVLSSVQAGHVAEEAAHYVRLAGERKQPRGFFGIALEEGFSYLASRWIDPDRRIPTPPRSEQGDVWQSVHLAGYRLGAQMADAWSRSASARRKIRSLWSVRPRDEDEARFLYFALGGESV